MSYTRDGLDCVNEQFQFSSIILFKKAMVLAVFLVMIFFTFIACSNPQESARNKLKKQGINYAADDFIFKAARNGDINAVELFLQAGIDINAADANGQTALMVAADNAQENVVFKLIENGANINAKDMRSHTALRYAAEAGHGNIVQTLLENGADLNVKSNTGATALMGASWAGYKDVVEALLNKGANVNEKDYNGKTALMWAASAGNVEVVNILLNNGADVNEKDNAGDAVLIQSVIKGQSDIVRALLGKGADVNTKSISGKTALMWANLYGRAEVIQALIENGAESQASVTNNTYQAQDQKPIEVGITTDNAYSGAGQTDYVKGAHCLNNRWNTLDASIADYAAIGGNDAVVFIGDIRYFKWDSFETSNTAKMVASNTYKEWMKRTSKLLIVIYRIKVDDIIRGYVLARDGNVVQAGSSTSAGRTLDDSWIKGWVACQLNCGYQLSDWN